MKTTVKVLPGIFLALAMYVGLIPAYTQSGRIGRPISSCLNAPQGTMVSFQAANHQPTSGIAGKSGSITSNNLNNNHLTIKNTTIADTAWTKVFQGNGKDEFYSVQQTADGGYIMAGKTNSSGAGDFDGWLVKTDASGNVIWQHTYGDSYIDEFYNVKQTSDGGYIACGMTTQYGWAGEGWLARTDSEGNIIWSQGFHPENGSAVSAWDYLYDVVEAPNGGFVAVGYAPLAENMIQAWILKVNTSGVVEWENTFGGEYWDRLFSLQRTNDGGYVAAGDQHATYNDSIYKHDGWLVKFNSTGDTLWTRHFGAQDHDIFRSVMPTAQGYIMVGERQVTEPTGYQAWMVKTNESGVLEWTKDFSAGAFYGLQIANDGTIMAAGTRINSLTLYDGWLMNVDQSGNELSHSYLPGSGLDDMFLCLSKTADGAYIGAGKFNSQMTSGEGWLVKLLPGTMLPLLHFVQNFDTVTPPALPTNWSVKMHVLLSNTIAEVKTMPQGSTTSAPNAVFIMNGLDGSNGQPDTAAFVTLITPYVTVGNSGARLIFYGNGGNNLQVGTMSDPTNASTFNLVEEIPLSYNFVADTVVFMTPGNTYIALKHKNSSPCMPIFIDDVTYEQIINVGIDETARENARIYPNPVKHSLTVESPYSNYNVRLINVLGQEVFSRQNISDMILNINVSGQQPGTYFLNLEAKNGNIINKKIVLAP